MIRRHGDAQRLRCCAAPLRAPSRFDATRAVSGFSIDHVVACQRGVVLRHYVMRAPRRVRFYVYAVLPFRVARLINTLLMRLRDEYR